MFNRVPFPAIGPTRLRPAWYKLMAELTRLGLLPAGFAPSRSVYVDANYTGGDSDGSPEKPFLTIQQGINRAWTTWGVIAYGLISTVYVAPGVYNETALVFYPFVHVYGLGGSQSAINVSSVAPIRVYSFGDYSIANLWFSTAWDSVQTSTGYFNYFTWVRFWRCRFDSTFRAKGRGANQHWHEFHDCMFFDSVTGINDTLVLDSCQAYGDAASRAETGYTQPVTAKDGNQYAAFLGVYGGFVGAVSGTQVAPAAFGSFVELDTFLTETLTVDGAGVTFELPNATSPEDGLAVLNGAQRFYPPFERWKEITSADAGTTLLDGVRYYVPDTEAGSFAVNLPSPLQCVSGVTVFQAGSGTLTINAAGGATIRPGGGSVPLVGPNVSTTVSGVNAANYAARTV